MMISPPQRSMFDDAFLPIRVLVVDDSVITRSLICRWLEDAPDIQVIGTASDGRAAINMVQRHVVDVVLLDIEMPVLDGLQALPQLLSAQPHLKIIMASSLTRRNAQITLRALELGAVDYLTKPGGTLGVLDGQDFRTQMLEKIRHIGRLDVRPDRPRAGGPPVSAAAGVLPRAGTAVPENSAPEIIVPEIIVPEIIVPEIIVLGCSTGGPNALNDFFGCLPAPLPVPVVIVQHMPPIFTDILAQQLQRSHRIACSEAVNHETLKPGHVYLAPGDFHARLAAGGRTCQIELTQDPAINFCRPAVDPLFSSAAQLFGNRALGVVLTGMGRDGLAGAQALRATGADVFVQDEATSVVWGMPGAIARADLATHIDTIPKLVARIVARTAP